MTRTYLQATVEHFPTLVGVYTLSSCIVKHVISRGRQNPRIRLHVVATLLPVEAHEDVLGLFRTNPIEARRDSGCALLHDLPGRQC